MLTRSELPDHPAAMTVVDGDGRTQVVTAARMRGGRVRLTCSCSADLAQGWCRHQVELLCLRYDHLATRDDQTEFHFEDVVMGTPLADIADEVDLALSDYERAAKALHGGPAPGYRRETLARTAAMATDLADAARVLDLALDRFKKRLAEGRAPQTPYQAPA